jgi:hypothetical protein
VTGHKYWDAIVVVTALVIDLFHGIATGENSAVLLISLRKRLPIPEALAVSAGIRSKPIPLVEPHDLSPPGLPGLSLGRAM